MVHFIQCAIQYTEYRRVPVTLVQVIASVVSMPEEVCDLNPQKICRFKTTLVIYAL